MRKINLSNQLFWKSLHLQKDKLQKNLYILHKKLGDHWMITYKSYEIPLFLEKIKSENGVLPIYLILYGAKQIKKNKLSPFKISLTYNPTGTKKINEMNDANIFNFHKIDKDDYPQQKPISGTTLMKILLIFLKKIGVNNVYLKDRAGFSCTNETNNHEVLITPFKLIEKKRSFYEKFGFKPQLTHDMIQFLRYKNIQSFQKMIHASIKEIYHLQNKQIHLYLKRWIQFITKIYVSNDYQNVSIYKSKPTKYSEKILDKNENKKIMDEYRDQCIQLESILPKKGYLTEWLKKIFYSSCKDYQLAMNVFKPNFRIMKYGKKTYLAKYKNDFWNLFNYLDMDFKLSLSAPNGVAE